MIDPLLPYNFIFEQPLYTEVLINEENKSALLRLLKFRGKIDAYNPTLKQESTFLVSPPSFYNEPFNLYNLQGFHEFNLSCVRNDYKLKIFVLLYNNASEDDDEKTNYVLMKVGQYPSIADLHISKVKDYDKVLSREKIKEMTRAIGLAANGVGIGSFVYLRRIFEHLIEEARSIAEKDSGWNEAAFLQSRMANRIEILKGHLPAFLVANKNMYGILSTGIHELKEQECLKYFDALKVGIELILDEKLEQQAKEKKLLEAQAKLQSIIQEVNKP